MMVYGAFLIAVAACTDRCFSRARFTGSCAACADAGKAPRTTCGLGAVCPLGISLPTCGLRRACPPEVYFQSGQCLAHTCAGVPCCHSPA